MGWGWDEGGSSVFIKISVSTCGTGRCHNQDDKRGLKYCIAEDNVREILCSDSNVGEDLSLLGCGAVSSGEKFLNFRSILIPWSLGSISARILIPLLDLKGEGTAVLRNATNCSRNVWPSHLSRPIFNWSAGLHSCLRWSSLVWRFLKEFSSVWQWFERNFNIGFLRGK